jgi:hypothetical protein
MENRIGRVLTKVNQFIQFRIDTTNFMIDKPKFDYQPLPWLGIKRAEIRGEATYARWEAIKGQLANVSSLKDIGCCVGFFCHSAADEFGINTIGIDMNDRFLRIANRAKCKIQNGDKEIFFNLKIDIDTVNLLPKTDSTILFSVWHHWVFYYGLDGATKILKSVWESTNNVLFFESGEEETKEEFNLPFDKKASIWLKEYLVKNLEGSEVTVLGEFEAGNYKHYEIKKYKRTVFSIVKK